MTVKFNISKTDLMIIDKVVTRARQKSPSLERLELEMDITATHLNGCELDLEKLLNFDDFNFWHDISGIRHNIDRNTGTLSNCFLPRCAR